MKNNLNNNNNSSSNFINSVKNKSLIDDHKFEIVLPNVSVV